MKHLQNPVLGGEYGTCFDISMLNESDGIKMYFSWRDRQCIAVCESTDGINWSEPEICITPRKTPEGWEDDLNRPSILKCGAVYRMWYTGQYKPGQADGTSQIFHAVSEDGIHFTRTSSVPVLKAELSWEKQAVMCPCVLWDESAGIYRMWYSGGEQYEPNAIGYAESTDGYIWKKYDLNPILMADESSSWERHKVAGCQVLRHDNLYWMLYIGYHNEDYAQIGMACSSDGISNWKRSRFNPIIAPDIDRWDGDACYKPFALNINDCWMLWYNGRKGLKEQIGLAVHEGSKLEV